MFSLDLSSKRVVQRAESSQAQGKKREVDLLFPL